MILRASGSGGGPGGRDALARARAAGQGIVEFGLIIALAALVAVAILVLFRPQLAFVLSLVGSEVEKAGWLVGVLPA